MQHFLWPLVAPAKRPYYTVTDKNLMWGKFTACSFVDILTRLVDFWRENNGFLTNLFKIEALVKCCLTLGGPGNKR